MTDTNATTTKATQRIAALTIVCTPKAGTEFTANDIHDLVKADPLFAGENSRVTVGNYLRKVPGLVCVGTVTKPAGSKGKPANRYTYQAPAA